MKNLFSALFVLFALLAVSLAQTAPAAGSIRVIRYSGTVLGPASSVQVTFSFYADRTALQPLWQETQSVPVTTGGRFHALIGAQSEQGIPDSIFTGPGNEALYLGVSINGEPELPRDRLVAVPYALKAFDADRIAGLDISHFVTREEFAASLALFPRTKELSSAAASRPESSDTRPGRTPRPDVSPVTTGTPQFTIDADGFMHVSRNVAGGVTIQADALASGANTATGVSGSSLAQQGIGIRGDALATSGANSGILGTTQSSAGYAGLFNNAAAGKIVGFQSGGTEVAFVDAAGFHGNISGNAATATLATNALQLGGVDAVNYALATAVNAEATTRGLADTTLQTNINATNTTLAALSSIAVKTNQANTFASNTRQTFVAGANQAGLNLNGVSADPASLVNGDLWLRSDQSRLYARVSGTTRPIAFADDPVSGNAATATALAANGANCSAGQYARGIDAAGNAEGCSTDIAGRAETAGTADDALALGGILASNYIYTETLQPFLNTLQAQIDQRASFGGNNTFAGINDFSQAGRTLPIQVVTFLPVACAPNAEMVIYSPANSTQQVRICNSTGDGWAIVGADGSTTNPVVTAPTSTAFEITLNPLGLIIGANSCAVDLPATVTGAAVGDPVVLALAPNTEANLPAGLMLFAWVSSANNVTLRMCNNTGNQIGPLPSPLIKVSGRILKF